MTNEQKQQLEELLKLQRADERRERDKLRRNAQRYVKERFGITFKELTELLAHKDDNNAPWNYGSTSMF